MINFTGNDKNFNTSADLLEAAKKVLYDDKSMKKDDDKSCDKNKDSSKKMKWKDFLKKEEEQLDELSKSTLSSYVKKAEPDAIEARRRHTDAKLDKDKVSADAYLKKSKNRMKGMDTAVDKLTKESEQLDELSKDTLKSYKDKAKKEFDKPYDSEKEHPLQSIRKKINRFGGMETAKQKLAKEGIFEANNRRWQTVMFENEDELNSFLEDNEDYGYIGKYDGYYHSAKLDDDGEPLHEISKNTLHSYLKKNLNSTVDADLKGDNKTIVKRRKGFTSAMERMLGTKKTSEPKEIKEDVDLSEEEKQTLKHPGHEFLNMASNFFKSNPYAYKTTELKYTGPSMSKTKATMSMAHLGYDHHKTKKDGEVFVHPKHGYMKVKFNCLNESYSQNSNGPGNLSGAMGMPAHQETTNDDMNPTQPGTMNGDEYE